MSINSMRAHREKMLAIKAQKQAQSQDPRKRKVAILGAPTAMQIAVDLAEVGADRTVVSPTANIELRLFNHLNELKETKSVQEKIAKKKAWLPEYMGYIEGSLAVSPSTQNTTLITLMIWAIDAGEYDVGVRIAEYAILNEMVMPEGYSRGIAEFVTEQTAIDFIDDTELAMTNADIIDRIIELGVGEQMVDEARAKIYRAKGDALKEVQPIEALNAYNNALRLNNKVGCKKDVTQLEKLLAKSTESITDATVGSQAVPSADQNVSDAVPASTDTETETQPATSTDQQSANGSSSSTSSATE